MYLKSLVLKGFKSFADRSVLTVEPGITAIVGPNGSGKSNISDAVLWVLGERSAKNLRGQAMEDIIFSGSAARKAVSVAEVELVLDNSDGTVPVDYDEVSIARRMYRSGESEYLLNGAIVRRLDVLEMLHDTGLGTGTHSIISQGSLDTILQSKPEDRRALIEEAAGVLKHKQRKERSARKLVAMDHHLDRVRDITAEVERQLGPLERKAKRAKAYHEAKDQLSDLKLSLAVDDLRKLQTEWERVCASEKSIGNELAESRSAVDSAEKNVMDIQEAMRRENEDAGELARKQRRCSQISERLDSSEKVLRERRRGAVDYRANLVASLDSHAGRMASAQADLESSRQQLEDATQKLSVASTEVERLTEEMNRIDASMRSLESQIEEHDKLILENDRAQQNAQRSKAELQEGLSNCLAHERLVEARKIELSSDLEKAKQEHENALSACLEAEELLTALSEEESQAQADLVRLFEARDNAIAMLEDAQSKVKVAETELKALERAQRSAQSGNESLTWVVDHINDMEGALKPLVQSLRAPKTIEELVEHLLGEDISAVSVDAQKNSRNIAQRIAANALKGDVSIVPRTGEAESKVSLARSCSRGEALADLFEGESQSIAETLFGDVVLCDTSDEAFKAHAEDTHGLVFVSRDGCAIWPSGKVRVYGKASSEDQSVLARERRCDELRNQLEELRTSVESLSAERNEAEDNYRSMQAKSLQSTQAHANQKGVVSAAKNEEARTAARLSACAKELESIETQVVSARETVSDIRPKMDEIEELIESLTVQRNEIASKRQELLDEAVPLRSENNQVSERLASAKLEKATLIERETYASRMVVARERDLETLVRSATDSRVSSEIKAIAVERADRSIEIIERLATMLQRRMAALDEAVAASENSATSVHQSAAQARLAAREAHDRFDAVSERMAQVRVDKSRLEVQVDTAVKAVVIDCGVPLDKASELPEIEDRRAAEDEAFKLERRMKNMGSISPDAEEEYLAVKKRYDYLSSQLSDMESARKSLRKIMNAIDERMKDDFVRTFAQVNDNFGEIFSILFPGGSASLSLENPEDVENSGVEVTAQPRGKRLTKMMLMSGGEKSLTALALLFAVYKTRSTPFYILDEVEAALDDTNLRRLMSYIDTLRQQTQLIMITHQRRTMEMADVLFGVSMQADGVTKVVSQKLERALEQAE